VERLVKHYDRVDPNLASTAFRGVLTKNENCLARGFTETPLALAASAS
jgi:hypothetical protein